MKLLIQCLSTELNSSSMLKSQGSCYSSRSRQGQVSQPGTKHTHIASALLSGYANGAAGQYLQGEIVPTIHP